ncbi:MAG: protein-L-isoaspartate(D-aspartate) O-methyltransferase [Lentisphaeria bacterium]
MVRGQLLPRGIRDPRILEAMLTVPRHHFCRPGTPLAEAHADYPLPVGCGQTISQPYMVALMLECLELKGSERVLEIGTGSGYNAALLGRLAAQVVTVECIPELAAAARQRLAAEGCANVEVIAADGSGGWPAAAPYDGIVVTAAAPAVPPALAEQLAEGGRLAIPVGSLYLQDLIVVVRRGERFAERLVCGCRFVPLRGRHGWDGEVA